MAPQGIYWLAQVAGLFLVSVALVDIYLTVLYPRGANLRPNALLNMGVWRLFRQAAVTFPSFRDRLLSHSGPVLMVLTVVGWVFSLVTGFALIIWPALGSAIQAAQGETPTDFVTALYYSGYSLTTLGVGDLVPKTGAYRMLTVLESLVGFSVITLSITYFLSVYGALVRRNAFALSLYHRASGKEDAAELLARLTCGGDFSTARQDIGAMAGNLLVLLQSHQTYPVLHYFWERDEYYALPRVALVTMDMATLIASALDDSSYDSIVGSAEQHELWSGGLHLIKELSYSLMPGGLAPRAQYLDDRLANAWRRRYHSALVRLKAAGIKTVEDEEEGADRYVSLRREWDGYVKVLADYLAYGWYEIAPSQ